VSGVTRRKVAPARERVKALNVVSRLDIRHVVPRFRAPRILGARDVAFTIEGFVPNIASAKKNMRKTRAATVRNRAQRSALRTALKKANAAGASAEVKLQAVRLLDRAARKGIIHRNAAGRYKSRLAKAS
jgi:small subunit ribosomal protein S20